VVLNSIHNDGKALELKIKDIIKWKMESFDEKNKARDEKIMNLQVAHSNLQRQVGDSSSKISQA
jgi:hypothetical protein